MYERIYTVMNIWPYGKPYIVFLVKYLSFIVGKLSNTDMLYVITQYSNTE